MRCAVAALALLWAGCSAVGPCAQERTVQALLANVRYREGTDTETGERMVMALLPIGLVSCSRCAVEYGAVRVVLPWPEGVDDGALKAELERRILALLSVWVHGPLEWICPACERGEAPRVSAREEAGG